MTIISGIFNSVNGDRKYNAKWFARYFSLFVGNGVFPTPSSGLQVMEGSNMQTVVKAGDGWINGYFIVNDSDHILQHDVADGVLKRIDRVVMRLDYLQRKIDIVVKKGASNSVPVAPSLQRDTDAYELALADVLINNGATQISQANITDNRLNKQLCGIVHGLIDQVDLTTIFNQYNGWFDDFTVEKQAEFEAWVESLKDILEGDVAANLAGRLTSLENRLSDYVTNTGYAVAGGTANAISITLNPAPTQYKDGMSIAIKVTAQNTGASTVNVNGLGVKSLMKSNGNPLTSGSHKVGGIYPYRYNATTGNFQSQGEGGEYGNVTSNDVRLGKTFGTENGVANGTLDLSNLVPSNIKKGVTIDGKLGTLEPLPPAVSGGNVIMAITNMDYISSPVLEKVKELKVKIAGNYTIKTNLWVVEKDSNGDGQLQLYVNGIAQGSKKYTNSQHPSYYSETVFLNVGDTVSVSIGTLQTNYWAYNTLLSLNINQENPYASVLKGN